MIEVFLVIGLLWLLVLTVAFAGIVRHLAAMQVAGVGSAAPEGGWLFDTDGPWVPSALPDRAAAALHGHGIPTDDLVVTFFSAHCGSCLERASQVAAVLTDPARNVFLVTGTNPDSRGDVARILAPTGVPIVTDPDAHDVVKSLDINSTRSRSGSATGRSSPRRSSGAPTPTCGSPTPRSGPPSRWRPIARVSLSPHPR